MAVRVFNLLLSVFGAIFVTFFKCVAELFRHFIFPRKLKSAKGKIVVVTGAGHGIGRRLACEFGRLGSTVVCWDIDLQRNQNTVWDINHTNGKAFSVICDVTDRLEVIKTAEYIRHNFGDIDIFINCVGIYPVQEILSWTPQELYALFDTNVMAQFWMLQAVMPQMINKKVGHFVTISSAAAIAPVANEVPYSVTKSAISCLMDGMMQELKEQGHSDIKITTVHPYYTSVRDDIPVKFNLRFDRMSPDFVGKEIVKGILQEQEVISIPRFMLFWIHFMKLLPASARKRWRDIFYTKVYPIEERTMVFENGEKVNIVDLYKLQPLNNNSQVKEVKINVDVENDGESAERL